MADSIINCPNLAEADAIIVGAPYEQSASFGTGAVEGPRAIVSCLDQQIELFERRTRTEPARSYKIAHRMLSGLTNLPPAKMVDRVATALSQHQAFCVLLGGVHSVSIGALQAASRRWMPADVTVVQIDAHLDMRHDDSDYSDRNPSQFAHSCVMRRAWDMGFRTCSIGVRAYSEEESRFAVERSLPVFEWGTGNDAPIETVIAAIATEYVYLTVDIDGFDPSVAPGTGTPVPGGLSWAYGSALIERVFLEKTVIGADIVEVAPISESNLTEYAAAQLCYNLLSYSLLKKHKKLIFV